MSVDAKRMKTLKLGCQDQPKIHGQRIFTKLWWCNPSVFALSKILSFSRFIFASQIVCRSGDFDITKGTILDSELRPEQFNEVTCAIFQKFDLSKLFQIEICILTFAYLKKIVPSIVKVHFAWTWQCSTLNRSDEVVSLLMACIQPFCIRLPHHTAHNGQISPLTREVFGVLGLFHKTKTAQPGVSHFSISTCIFLHFYY